jgi:hypothetical protein
MIKQTWNIDSEEKVRILNLHESATKNLYLLKEQEIASKDNENAIRSNDKDDKFTYLVFQPQTSRQVSTLNWESPYFIVADDGQNAYVAQVAEKDSKNRPIKFIVELKNEKNIESSSYLSIAKHLCLCARTGFYESESIKRSSAVGH